MITFKTVSSRNFFSIGNNPIVIQLDRSPTTLVSGKNGSGKSSGILDAVYFALFGKPFRNVNIPNIVNSISGGGTVVELTFQTKGKSYLIKRGLKPKLFEIYENDKLVDQDAATRDYQKHLENNILGGINETVFKQIVILGSADYRPFMQLPAAARREVIEELLDIKIFSNMMDVTKQKLSAIKEVLKDLDYKIDLAKEKLDVQLENRKKIREQNKAKKDTLDAEIQKEEMEINAINNQIIVLTEEKQKLVNQLLRKSEIEKKLNDDQLYLASARQNVESAIANIEFFTKNDNCPYCRQGIPHDHKAKLTENEELSKEVWIEKYNGAKEALEKSKKIIAIMTQLQTKVVDIERAIYKHQADIDTRKKYIRNMQKEVDDIQLRLPVEDSLKSLEKEYLDLKAHRIQVLEDRQYHEAAATLLKDGGIKTKIIRQYIPVMNMIINEYLTRLGLPVEFTLDEQFNEVIKSRYRDSFKYNNFSEGEKQRIDTSLMLAWRHIAKMKNTTNTNLLILDETFDSSLDAHATDELLNILLAQDKGTNIFVISHKQDLSDKLRSQIIFEKHNNYTRIVGEEV